MAKTSKKNTKATNSIPDAEPMTKAQKKLAKVLDNPDGILDMAKEFRTLTSETVFNNLYNLHKHMAKVQKFIEIAPAAHQKGEFKAMRGATKQLIKDARRALDILSDGTEGALKALKRLDEVTKDILKSEKKAAKKARKAAKKAEGEKQSQGVGTESAE